ncbi:hypothetical protein P3S68_011644 [Capsicum galapagoense]
MIVCRVEKNQPAFMMYPLCISTTEKCEDDILFDRKTGVVVCLKGVEFDALALSVAETQNEYALYVPEVEDNLICDSKSIDVKVKQMNKDKNTLVSVMSKYKVTNGFNVRAKRSDKKSSS